MPRNPRSNCQSSDGRSTLVIQTAFLGDVVLTTPLLERLAARFGPVDVLITPAAAALLRRHPAVRRGRSRTTSAAATRGFGGLGPDGARAPEARRYERVYLPHRSVRSAALALATGFRERIGFVGCARRLDLHGAGRIRGRARDGAARLARRTGPVPRPSLGLYGDRSGTSAARMARTGRRPARIHGARPGFGVGHQALAVLRRPGGDGSRARS